MGYSCEVCTTTFFRMDHLATHMRYHTGERPFSCKVCMFSSAKQSDVTRHMKQHTGIRPYVCSVCNRRFLQAVNLRTHQSRRHPNESSSDTESDEEPVPLKRKSAPAPKPKPKPKQPLQPTPATLRKIPQRQPMLLDIFATPPPPPPPLDIFRDVPETRAMRLITCRFCSRTFLGIHAFNVHQRINLHGTKNRDRVRCDCPQCTQTRADAMDVIRDTYY